MKDTWIYLAGGALRTSRIQGGKRPLNHAQGAWLNLACKSGLKTNNGGGTD